MPRLGEVPRQRRSEPPQRPAHVAAMVQNVSLAEDKRLRKQLVHLRAAGHHVSVITRANPDNAPWRDAEGVTLVEYQPPVDGTSLPTHLREYAASFARQVPGLLRLHLRHPVDLLQIAQPPDCYFPVALAARRLGIPVLLDQRDLMPETFEQRYPERAAQAGRLLHWLERRTQAGVDASVTVNGYLRERLVAAGGTTDSVRVVGNGPRLALVRQAGEDLARDDDRDELRRGFACVATWAGKMGRQDRVSEVVDIAHRIVRDWGRRDVGFMLLGHGKCLEELRAQVVRLGLTDHVWFPGWLDEVDLYHHLAVADVGVDTSLQPEVTPVKALEYLAAELPLVAYDLPETRRLAAGAGVLVTPDDAETLARELLGLLDDPHRRARLGAVGGRRIQEELAWDLQAEVYLDVVADLLTRSRSRRGRRTRRNRAAATPAPPGAV